MNPLTKETVDELLAAMDTHKLIAQELIDKLISETDQPEKFEIMQGRYDLIENADLLNGEEHLNGNWYFNVHGEHCMFRNLDTGQTLEVSLGEREDVGNVDPYFFYSFLESRESFKHLTQYFDHPFTDMLNFFEVLVKQNILKRIRRVEFRKT